MAAPTQPTTTTIVTEAWKLFGKANPTSSDITRAVSYGVEIVKSDLKDLGMEWSFLRKVAYRTLTEFVSKVQLPTDCAKPYSVKILKAVTTGTLQAATANTLTLAADDSLNKAQVEGHWLAIVDGAGDNQALQCKDYDSTTKVATMAENWETTPDGSETYAAVDSFENCKLQSDFSLDAIRLPSLASRPTIAYHTADSAEGDLTFNYAPDDNFTYIAQIRYYGDILKESITSTLYNRMLYLLNALIINGVFVWCLQDDARATIEFQKYQNKLNRAAGLYLYPNQVSETGSTLDYK